jgi:hypothetical protein
MGAMVGSPSAVLLLLLLLLLLLPLLLLLLSSVLPASRLIDAMRELLPAAGAMKARGREGAGQLSNTADGGGSCLKFGYGHPRQTCNKP